MGAMRRSNKLSATKVVKITAPGMYGDGDGLWLQVREVEDGLSKTWIFRYMLAGRARYMGLGPLRQVPLAKELAKRATSSIRGLILSKRVGSVGMTQEAKIPSVCFSRMPQSALSVFIVITGRTQSIASSGRTRFGTMRIPHWEHDRLRQ
jgi:hypothetical protein